MEEDDEFTAAIERCVRRYYSEENGEEREETWRSLKIELEKERRAAESAAEEAIDVLLKLRMEKGVVEMDAKHYKRVAEQQQVYDQEVIQSLQWMLMKLDDH